MYVHVHVKAAMTTNLIHALPLMCCVALPYLFGLACFVLPSSHLCNVNTVCNLLTSVMHVVHIVHMRLCCGFIQEILEQ